MHPFFVRSRLSAYLDGDLSPRERQEVERLLSRHPDLEAELQSVQSAVRLLSEHGTARAPSRLVPEVLQALEERRRSPFRGPGRIRSLLLFLAAATAIATGLALWMRQAPTPDPLAELPAEPELPGDAAAAAPGEVEPGELGPGELGPGEIGPGELGPGEIEPGTEVAGSGAAGDSGEGAPAGDPPAATPPAPPPEAPSTASIQVADDGSDLEPYVPSWDQDPVHHEEGSPSLLQVAVYRVYASRADILQDLHELARARGTLMVDSLGKPLQIRPLEGGDDFASVHLTLPTDGVQSFLSELARLGLAVEIAPPDPSAEQQELLLEVMYKP